jgi:hypothetical protein
MFMDPHTNKLLADYAAKEMLEQAEQDRLAKQLARRDNRLLNHLGTIASNWLRRPKAPAAEPLRRTSAETHS